MPHGLSNPIETNLLLDAYASGQLPGKPTLISPQSIEVNGARGLQTFDPRLVDPSVLKALSSQGQPYGPPQAPETTPLAKAMLARQSGLLAKD